MLRSPRRYFTVPLLCAVFLLSLPATSSTTAVIACPLSGEDRVWLAGTFDTWRRVSLDSLGLAGHQLPWIVVFDATCVWQINAEPLIAEASSGPADEDAAIIVGGAPVRIRSAAHGGVIRTPDGNDIPPVLTSFTATYGREATPYVVMAMPALWRKDARHSTDASLDTLIRSVFAHEMTHAAQSAITGPRLDALSARLERPAELDDDIIQTRFEAIPDFREAYERERNLLYEAARQSDPGRRRALAGEALRAMESRRARFFGAGGAVYGELEDIFLVMEGVGNWAAYRAAIAEGLAETDAVSLIRREGKRWSQDEGLAIFLVLEAQRTGWRAKVFGAGQPYVLELLREASE